MMEGGLASDSDSYDKKSVDGPGLVKKGRHEEGHIIHPFPGDDRDQVYGGGSVPNGGSGPTNWHYGGIDDDSPGDASRVRGEACRGGTPHVNGALSGESSKKQVQSAERMLSCPSSRRAGNARPPSPWNFESMNPWTRGSMNLLRIFIRSEPFRMQVLQVRTPSVDTVVVMFCGWILLL